MPSPKEIPPLMPTPEELFQTSQHLRNFGQPGLAQRLEAGGPEGLALWEQATSIDWPTIQRLFQDPTGGEESIAELAARAVSPPGVRLAKRQDAAFRSQAEALGEQALAAGEVAVLVVAGGQGTRLGFDAPKGMYPVGPVSQATLYQLLLEQLLALRAQYGKSLPLYVMTSDATFEATQAFLVSHAYFGLSSQEVILFKQGTMPAVDAQTGEVLLSDPHTLALSPDGHGGMLAALKQSGGLERMHAAGIKHLFYLQVDNPLVTVGDEEFLGYHLLHQSEVSTQVVAKQAPGDKVGVVGALNGKVRIIEYSDLPAEAAAKTAPDGSLLLWAGNTAIHVFDLAFLAQAAERPESLPFHIARKAVPYLNADNELVKPAATNALKFERFIFDLLPLAKQAIVMEVDPAEAFVPLKNASGAAKDSPEHVRAALSARAARWLTQAGCHVSEPVEISPLLARRAADLGGKFTPGHTIPSGSYLRPDST